SVTFNPSLLAQTHQLQLVSSGTIWIDAMQIEPGSAASDYQSRNRAEVSLAVSLGNASAARIQFIDEPPLIDFAVTGKASGAILKTKVINLYGKEQSLPDVKLSDDFIRRGELKYDVFPNRPLGQFRIEAWV